MDPENPTPLRIALDRTLRPWVPEVRYALDHVLEIAGYAREWCWADEVRSGRAVDIWYGPPLAGPVAARIAVPWSGRGFAAAGDEEPVAWVDAEGLPVVAFPGEEPGPPALTDGQLRHATDAVFAAFWWLSGAREPRYHRDRMDNISLAGTFLRESGLAGRPWISLWAALLRRHLESAGRRAAPAPWPAGALALSHDVDYPEIVRAVELLRHPAHAAAVLTQRDPFWRFDDWADFAEDLGTRSAFYFMARRGSLLRYAGGEPDAFYDVTTPRYRVLLAALLERGCEVGLHASFRSCEEPERLSVEKRRVEEACGAAIRGNRQHYWRLDPQAPHETLHHLAEAGFTYDSSLAFERMPGFRRGTCHPFRPWHPVRRAALPLLELPPAWMDDHYVARLADGGVGDPDDHAASLLADVHASGGTAVLDYHVRGMNERFFPRWGAWLRRLLPAARPAGMVARLPLELAEAWRTHADALGASSRNPLGDSA